MQLLPIVLIGAGTVSTSAQDAGASLTIGFANNANRFHVGEIIPIDLSFAASTPDTYEMDTRTYDRNGRLNIEQFHVTPPGCDPLHDYYQGGLYGGFSGGAPFAGSEACSNLLWVGRHEAFPFHVERVGYTFDVVKEPHHLDGIEDVGILQAKPAQDFQVFSRDLRPG
jgi:hypothetical protein